MMNHQRGGGFGRRGPMCAHGSPWRSARAWRWAGIVCGVLMTCAWSPPVRAQGQPNRQELEQRFRQRLATVVKTQLGLTDGQLQQLAAVNRRYESERTDLNERERQSRLELRREVQAGNGADQRRVDELLQELFRIQRRRLDLTEREQRDLSTFLTPVQRVQYLTIQDRLRQRLDQLRRQQGRRGATPQPDRDRRPPGRRPADKR